MITDRLHVFKSRALKLLAPNHQYSNTQNLNTNHDNNAVNHQENEVTQDQSQQTYIMQCPTSMALLFILSLETILVCIMESFVLFYHTKIFSRCEFSLNTIGLGQADFIYHGLYIATPVYQLCLYLDTLRQRNVFQMLALVLFGGLMVIFSGIQTMQHMIFEQAGCDPWNQNGNNTTTFPNATDVVSSTLKMSVIISNTTKPMPDYQDVMDANISNIRPFEYAALAVIIIVFFIMLGCSFKLYKLFRWDNYLFHTFADIRLRNTLISWAIFTGLLKIDFFFAFAYAIQLVPTALIGYTSIPLFESAVVFATSLVAFLLAIHSIRNEYMKTLIVFNVIALGSIGYFGYRLYTFGVPRETTTDPFLLTRYNLLFTTLTLTLFMILTLCVGLVCVRNVVLNKVRILQDFKCICPTCYFHSSVTSASQTSNCSLKTSSLDLADLSTQNNK